MVNDPSDFCLLYFLSRFLRAALPSPKRYLAATRLLYAAALLEIPGFSVADAAYRLEYSSPQSFGRHVRAILGATASERQPALAERRKSLYQERAVPGFGG